MSIEFSVEEKMTGLDMSALMNGIDKMVDLIRKDYKEWSDLSSRYDGDSDSRRKIKDEMIEEFNNNIGFHTKILKIFNCKKMKVWRFIPSVWQTFRDWAPSA